MDLLVADLLLVGVTLSSSVLLHLVGFDAETLDIVLRSRPGAPHQTGWACRP